MRKLTTEEKLMLKEHPGKRRVALGEERISEVVTPCATCRHRNDDGYTCKAFEDGIPQPILSGENDHTKPYPGDGGIRWQRR